MAFCEEVEDLIRNDLKPRLKELNQVLQVFQYSVELEKEKLLLDRDETVLKVEFFQKETEEKVSYAVFDIKTYFTPDIINIMDDDLKCMLEECKFDDFRSVRFDYKIAFDVVIDEKNKVLLRKGGLSFFEHRCFSCYYETFI